MESKFKVRPTLYVAGPYTRPDPVANTHAVIKTAELIYAQTPWVPVIPHLTMLWHAISPHDYEFWCEYDLHVLASCDAIVRLPGESSGADVELRMASQFWSPVPVYPYKSLPTWIREYWEATRGQ